MKLIDDTIRKQLREPFPAEAISQHPTKTFLSTIKAIYIVERLNDIFGIGGWTLEHDIVSDETDYVAVKGRLVIFEPYNILTPFQYGGHKKTGTNTEPADGYKSAVTDCQSKCASYLEIGIDIFKGKTKAPSGGGRKKPPPSSKKEGSSDNNQEMSNAQWEFIKKLGTQHDLTEPEVITLTKWVADQNRVDPKHWKISKLMLPDENFTARLKEYNQALFPTDQNKTEDDIPF